METVVVELRREGGFDFWRFDLGKWAFSEICYMGVFGGGITGLIPFGPWLAYPRLMTMILNGSTAGHACVGIFGKADFNGSTR